jgi:protein ImuB
MLWAALQPNTCRDSRLSEASSLTDPTDLTDPSEARQLATWCLQFTPRVALVEPNSPRGAVVMELAASVRLFGGKRRLVERVKAESSELGVGQLSWAPTSWAAVALARAGRSNGFSKPLDELLDPLPLHTLTPVLAHEATLARIGCNTLGDVRRLPRGGISRRFDAQVLAALDEAYGLRPAVHEWVTLPETFSARLELMARVDLAAALLFGARRLLLQLCGWLTARHAGTTAFKLRWVHDSMRAKGAGEGGELVVRTAQPMRDPEHLCRLLAEQLARLTLAAPVGELELSAVDVQALEEQSLSLLPALQNADEGLALVLERIAARLGPHRVLRPVVREDHRPEWMTHWQTAPDVTARARGRQRARSVDIPQPTVVLPDPLKLALRDERPLYQGPLQLLIGPHLVEGGWWDRTTDEGEPSTRFVARDYWVALSEHAGVLWIFQTRAAAEAGAWYLHGVFA